MDWDIGADVVVVGFGGAGACAALEAAAQARSVVVLDRFAGGGATALYPTNRHYLYYSGSEVSARDAAPPAPRGHRTRGRGTSGGLLFARLAAATKKAGIKVVTQTTAVRLTCIVADGGAGGPDHRHDNGGAYAG